jgi:hypothetical protein
MEARLIFFLNFKGTPSQEEHKTIFSGFKIDEIALSDQVDFPAVPSLEDDLPEFQQFRNTNNPLSPLPCKTGLCCHVSEN